MVLGCKPDRYGEKRPWGLLPNEIYRCEACGNVVFVLEAGVGDLVCCGENMRRLTPDEARAFARHLPQ